jgi:hypothetical protein
VRGLARELRRIGTALRAGERRELVAEPATIEALHVRSRRELVIAANASPDHASMTVVFATELADASELFDGHRPVLDGRRLHDTLPPWGVHVYRVRSR